MATNFKDALLDGTPEQPTTPTPPRGRGRATTDAPAEALTPTTPPVEDTPTAPAVVNHAQDKTKVYHAIGLKDYATVIAGNPVYVEAGKPWQGTKFQYDTLKRAKLIQ